MRKYYICEIDVSVNKNKVQCLDIAMHKVYKHIMSKIDSTLPEDTFTRWYEDGADKPLRWNKNSFYWSR